MSFGDLDKRAALVAAITAVALAGCDGDEPVQTTAPAVTGATDTAGAGAPGTAPSGGEPAPDPKGDEGGIEATLTAVLVDGDACGDLVTERYVRRAYGGLAGCKGAEDGAQRAKRVRVRQVVVLPDSVAQASVAPVGGIYDDERLRAELVLEDGTWKLDSLRSNVPVGP